MKFGCSAGCGGPAAGHEFGRIEDIAPQQIRLAQRDSRGSGLPVEARATESAAIVLCEQEFMCGMHA